MRIYIKNAVIISSVFAAGMVTGPVLLSISGQKARNEIADRGKGLIKKGRAFTGGFSEKFRQNFSDPIPDLFEATESLSLSDDEIFHG